MLWGLTLPIAHATVRRAGLGDRPERTAGTPGEGLPERVSGGLCPVGPAAWRREADGNACNRRHPSC